MRKLSQQCDKLEQSMIRAASVACTQLNGVNLGQGICDLPVDERIQQAALNAMAENKNQYGSAQGVYRLRQKLADKAADFNQLNISPDDQIIVTHGATGAFVVACMALFNPGDEVIIFEPFYGYHRNILQTQNLTPISVAIDIDSYEIDWDGLQAAITDKTKGLIICTPNNPSGKVYGKQELLKLGELAEQHDLWVITDEIYEYITYPGFEHISFAALNNYFERTVTISGFSKTYNMTGWRLGYAFAPSEIIEKMTLLQDLYYVCPVTPLQYAMITAIDFEDEHYDKMRNMYTDKRDKVVLKLREIGFKVTMPQGAYYLLADISEFNFKDDIAAMQAFLHEAKVATVAGSAFFMDPNRGKNRVRLCYAMDELKVNQGLLNLENYFSNR